MITASPDVIASACEAIQESPVIYSQESKAIESKAMLPEKKSKPLLSCVVRIIACLLCILPNVSFDAEASQVAPVIAIEVHGFDMTWNGAPLSNAISLEQKCIMVRSQVKDMRFKLASGIDTSQAQVERIVSILHQSCGVRRVEYVTLLNTPDHKK